MAEQRDDGKPDTEPGTDIEPANGASPPAQPEIDPQELEQFRQFQQFQDYLRFSQAQQGNQPAPPPNGEMVPMQPPQPVPHQQWQPVPAQPGQVATYERPRRRAPRWLTWLGKKVLGWVIAVVLLGIAASWAYHHFFPSTQDDNRPASETGGQSFHATPLLAKNPFEAVRSVYDGLAKNNPDVNQMMSRACGPMDDATQQKFAADLGYPDCGKAAVALHAKVTNPNDYATSIPRYQSDQQAGDELEISSCQYAVKGGPPLGLFKVRRVELGQWLIVGHSNEPTPCPAPTR